MTQQTYTADMVTDKMRRRFWEVFNDTESATGTEYCLAAAITASPLWAEVQQLREAKRELVEALKVSEDFMSDCVFEYPGGDQENERQRAIAKARETLAKHGGGHE